MRRSGCYEYLDLLVDFSFAFLLEESGTGLPNATICTMTAPRPAKSYFFPYPFTLPTPVQKSYPLLALCVAQLPVVMSL